MSISDSRLRPNKEEVAAKVMDGEAILINLSTGVYFSMDNIGALIWELIECHHGTDEIVAELCNRYVVDEDLARTDVERVVAELAEENLIVVASDDETSDKQLDPPAAEKLEYSTPELNIYRDMGDLLALDPPTPGLEITPWQDSADEPVEASSEDAS